MVIRLSDHALRRMAEEGLSRDDVEGVIAAPAEIQIGATAVEY